MGIPRIETQGPTLATTCLKDEAPFPALYMQGPFCSNVPYFLYKKIIKKLR